MRTNLIVILLLGAIVPAACGKSGTPAATQAPATAPVAAKTEAPAAALTNEQAAAPTLAPTIAPTATGVEPMKMEEPTAAPFTNAAPSAEDLALFEQVTKTFIDKLIERVSSACLEETVAGRNYPLPEPDYYAKRPLDMSAFQAALDGFTNQRLAAAQANGLNYIISMAAPSGTVDAMTQGLLNPVVDFFVPAGRELIFTGHHSLCL